MKILLLQYLLLICDFSICPYHLQFQYDLKIHDYCHLFSIVNSKKSFIFNNWN